MKGLHGVFPDREAHVGELVGEDGYVQGNYAHLVAFEGTTPGVREGAFGGRPD